VIITVNSGSRNLANYLLYGNNNSRDQEKITILEGNAKLTDRLSKSISANDKHFHFIISANGKRSDADMHAIFKDFKKELLHSYAKDEVNLFAVLHQDTNNSHIHIQIPKKNLLTDTKLDLYYHKRDIRRFETIRDYLNLKYNEPLPSIPNKSNPAKNWRYNPQSISTKKEKLAFENMLLDTLYDNRSKFHSYEELIRYIKEDLKINVKKVGYDYKKDDFYITINHGENKKSQRIFSPLFNDGTSKYITQDDGTKKYIQYDFNTTPLERQREIKKQEDLQTLRAKLDKMHLVEKTRIDKRLGRMKPLAKQRRKLATDEHHLPLVQKIKPPSPQFKNIKKKSALQNQAQSFKLLQNLQQINLAEIATREFNFTFLQREDTHDIIQNKETNKQLLVYRDKDGYKYINPYNKKERGELSHFLQNNTTSTRYSTLLESLNPLKIYLSIMKDLINISEMVLDITLHSFLEKRQIQIDSLNNSKKLDKHKSPHIKGADLRPF